MNEEFAKRHSRLTTFTFAGITDKLMKRLPEPVIEAIGKLTSTFIDDTHPAVRDVRLFVLDNHEMFSGYLDRILVDLLIAVLPIPEGADPKPFAAHIEKQIARMSFYLKLELLKPSLAAYPELDVEALISLNGLRNNFAHSSANVANFTYKGRPLWQVSTIEAVAQDVFDLGLAIDGYFYSIDDTKKIAARESVSMPRYVVLAGWGK